MRAEEYIAKLNMRPHKEGGWFKENERNEEASYTSIYFLLEKGDVSHFHRCECDEMWYFHDGSAANIYVIDESGNLRIEKLGKDIKNGEMPCVKIPAGCIFGAEVCPGGTFTLVSCVCVPAFRYEGFELMDRYEMLRKYPEYSYIIKKLTK